MTNQAVQSTTIKVALDTKDQTREKVQEALDIIFRNGPCLGCGRIAVLSVELDGSPNQK